MRIREKGTDLSPSRRLVALGSNLPFRLAILILAATVLGASTDGGLARTLEERVAELEAKLAELGSAANNDWVIVEISVRIQRSPGSTDSIDGTGDLIIGDDEIDDRDRRVIGSELLDLITGPRPIGASYGGLVAELDNRTSGDAPAAVMGGYVERSNAVFPC